jgi:hypothetical protein
MADACAPFIQDGQTIILMPRSGGSLEFANIFSTLPYGARLKGPGYVSVLINAVILPTGVFPSKRTNDVIQKLKQFYPTVLVVIVKS